MGTLVYELGHARSGDKGNTSNVAVIAYDEASWEILRRELTAERVMAAYAHLAQGPVQRYEVQSLRALNFVIGSALAGGVTRSLRIDPHGKSLSSLVLGIELPASTSVVRREATGPLLFQPLKLRDVVLRNRIVISPMAQHAAPGGAVSDWMLVHLGKFALGGAGLVFTECTSVSAQGRIGKDDPGLWDDAQIEPLARVVNFVRAQGAAMGVQLGHAGRKAGSESLFDGGGTIDEAVMTTVDPRWQRVGPSPIAAGPGWSVPHVLDEAAIQKIIGDFCAAAQRADRAGADVLELHFGHGYLVTSFLSPLSNQRTDQWGGDRAGRMRLAVDIAAGVRAVWPQRKPLFCRVSSVDGGVGGWGLDDTVVLARALRDVGVDVIDCSSGGLTEQTRALPVPRGLGYQVAFARTVRQQAQVATQAVGMIVDPAQAEAILQEGSADLVALAREALRDPYWALHAQEELCPDPQFKAWPLRHRAWLARRQPALEAARRDAAAASMPANEVVMSVAAAT